jgi:hypothetical protein
MIGRLKSVAAATALLSALGCVPVSAQVSFKSFGVVNAYINDMSADGSVAVGILLGSSTTPSPAGSQAFRWTAAGGVQNIGGHMNEVYISRDGKTIVGSALDTQGNGNAAIWQGGTNWKLLGGPPGSVPQGSVPFSAAATVSRVMGRWSWGRRIIQPHSNSEHSFVHSAGTPSME